ncbi:MAG: OmpA/MotB family protein [Tepidisphaeraceae bacterium]
MAQSCHCKKKACECEECPEWIFTFADLVMLMMGFFVILWVLKPSEKGMTDKDKPEIVADAQWLETVGEIRGGFGWTPDPSSSDPVDKVMLAKRARLSGPGKTGNSRVEAQGAEGTDPEVTNIRIGRHSAVGGKLVFGTGNAELTEQAKDALNQIAAQIRGHRNIVMVKGHTSLDDLPTTASAQEKMDLSLRRAKAAADYLVDQGVSPDNVRVQGCSTFEPVLQRVYTPAAQSSNRRVEVEATSTLVEQLQDPAPRSPVPSEQGAPENRGH